MIMEPQRNTVIPDLGENHRRTISTTLSLLDEILFDFEQRMVGTEHESVLFRQSNSLTPQALETIRIEAPKMRQLLAQLRDDLRLLGHERDIARTIWSKAAVFWESLCELEERHLKAYGEVPAGLAEYLDPRIQELNDRLTRIAEAAMGHGEIAHRSSTQQREETA